jgi:hypothetical protein
VKPISKTSLFVSLCHTLLQAIRKHHKGSPLANGIVVLYNSASKEQALKTQILLNKWIPLLALDNVSLNVENLGKEKTAIITTTKISQT